MNENISKTGTRCSNVDAFAGYVRGKLTSHSMFSVLRVKVIEGTYSLLVMSCNGVADESCKLHGGCAEVKAKAGKVLLTGRQDLG